MNTATQTLVDSNLPDFKESDFSGDVCSGTFVFHSIEGDVLLKIPLWQVVEYIERFDMNSTVVVIRKSLDGNPANDTERIGYTPALKFLRENIEEVSRLYFLDNL